MQVEDVVEVMQPELEKARAAGVAVLVDASSPSLGRRADIIVAVSRAARLPVVVPTGFYLDPSIPEWARAASEEELRDWMVGELVDGIEEADVKAGWIKLAASESGLTEHERKCLRAAARGAQRPTPPSAAIARAGSWPATRWTSWKGRATEPSASSGYTPTLNPGYMPTLNATGACARSWRAEVHGWSSTRSGSPSPGGDAAPIDMMHIDMIQHMLDAGLGTIDRCSAWTVAGLSPRLPGGLYHGVHVPVGDFPAEAAQSRGRRGDN